MTVRYVAFSEKGDKVYLRASPSDGGKRVRQVLWGDHLEVLGEVPGNAEYWEIEWAPRSDDPTSYFIRKDETTEDRPLEIVFVDVGQGDGAVLISGTVYQENAPDDWFMPVPLQFEFGKNQRARVTVTAYGPERPFQVKLPMNPKKVELDPDLWILSEKTTTKGK